MPTSDQLLAKLFNFKATVVVKNISFYMRIVGDSVMEDARQYALLESRKTRRDLRRKDSDAYLVHLDPLNDFTDEELKNIIAVNASREVIREYIQTTPRRVIEPLGENPTQEAQEEYEAEKIRRDEEYFVELEAHVDSWREKFFEALGTKDHAYYMFMAERHQTDIICEQVFTDSFEDYVVTHSLYTDDKYKTRLFADITDFRQLPLDIRTILRAEYQKLTIGAEDLKN